MTTQEEPNSNQPSSSAKSIDGLQAASDMPAQDVHANAPGSGDETETVDFMTMAMFIIGKSHRGM